MPLFDFSCRACGREFELLVMGGGIPACPHCQSTELEKQVSSFAIGKGGVSSGSEAASSASAASGSKCGGCSAKSCSSCH